MRLYKSLTFLGLFLVGTSAFSLTVKELNEQALKEINATSVTNFTQQKVVPAQNSQGKIAPVILNVPIVSDDDLHYNLPISVYNSLTPADKNNLQIGCYMLGEALRAECKRKRYYGVLVPAKKLCKNVYACVSDRLEVVDYCAEHPTDKCEEEQSALVFQVREKCKTECSKHPEKFNDVNTNKCGQYECRRDTLQQLRNNSVLQKAMKPSTAPACPTCDTSENH